MLHFSFEIQVMPLALLWVYLPAIEHTRMCQSVQNQRGGGDSGNEAHLFPTQQYIWCDQ